MSSASVLPVAAAAASPRLEKIHLGTGRSWGREGGRILDRDRNAPKEDSLHPFLGEGSTPRTVVARGDIDKTQVEAGQAAAPGGRNSHLNSWVMGRSDRTPWDRAGVRNPDRHRRTEGHPG